MATIAELRQACRYLIGDTNALNYIFTDLQLDDFIGDAIDDISIHFPQVKSYAISCADDDRKYDLETDFIAVLSVEYPTGEDPPEYLLRRSYTDPNFWLEDGYYDIITKHSGDATNPSEIWISEKPSTGETITVHYKAIHDSDAGSILPRHEHLVALFVRWKAWQELATSEGMDPDPIKLLSATQEVNSTRAHTAYRDALNRARRAESESAVSSPWKMDKHDRIY